MDEPETCNLHPETFGEHRGNGKVARLPKPIRDQINHWLLTGLSYPEIIERLGEQGQDLNPGHLCEWKKRGYQDWLLQQNWLAETRARQEPAADLSTDFDATQLNHAALQLATLHIFEALRDLVPSRPAEATEPGTEPSPRPSDDSGGSGEGSSASPSALVPAPHASSVLRSSAAAEEERITHHDSPNSALRSRHSALDLRLGGDSAAFVRLINALARASRETMLVQKYREACAKARAALTELKDPHRKLTESETRAIVLQVDKILGLRSEDNAAPKAPTPSLWPPQQSRGPSALSANQTP
jgi:hypothetical protein